MDNFERLVSDISASERQELLKRFGKYADGDSASLSSAVVQEAPVSDPAEQFKTESPFFRLWIFVKSLFTSTSVLVVYNDYLVQKYSRKIAKEHPELFDAKQGYLLEGFYNSLCELKTAADFFKETVTVCEEDKGRFYVFLGSLLMKGVSGRIAEEVDPSSVPVDKEVSGDLRGSLLRKLEVVFQEIPSDEREAMYIAVQGFEWLKQFSRLPFEKVQSRFISIEGSGSSCPLDTVADELSLFCRVLCGGKRISVAVLESLYMFSSQDKIGDSEFDLAGGTASFVTKGIEAISTVKMFITSVPLRSITGAAFRSCSWVPDTPVGVEDWFAVYKAAWKKVFDQKWAAWLKEKKKELARQHILKFLSVKDIPQLDMRPWESLWGGFPFLRGLSMGFLKGFYTELYPSVSKSLKILMIEGDFYQRENRVEFTDAYNELNHQAQNIGFFEEKLSPKGQIGQGFEKLVKDSIRTIQGKARADALMLNVESESNVMLAQFCSCCRSLNSVLGGVLAFVRDTRYDSIANISTIQGKYNDVFRKQLQSVRECLYQAYEIIKEIEAVEINK